MRVYGYAKSIINLEKYTTPELFRKNLDCLSAFSFVFNKFCTVMPREVVQCHLKQLEDSGMPSFASSDIPPGSYYLKPNSNIDVSKGKGYVIHINGKDYVFPFAERSSPEGYLTTNYTA